MLNAHPGKVLFKLPGALPWQLQFDSSNPAIAPHELETDTYEVMDRAAVLLTAEIAL
jgi:hypothetical protein